MKKNSVSVSKAGGAQTTSQVSIENDYPNDNMRSGTSQSVRQSKNGKIKAAPQWNDSPFHKTKSYQTAGAAHKYSNSTGEKPYELWKQQMVTTAD